MFSAVFTNSYSDARLRVVQSKVFTMVLEQMRRHKKEAMAATPGAAPEQAPQLTLKEIFADKEHKRRFEKMLEVEQNEKRADFADIGSALADLSRAEPGDLRRFEGVRSLYAEKMDRARMLGTAVTPDSLTEMSTSSPHLADALNMIGKEEMVRLLQRQFQEIAVSDPTRFNAITSAFASLSTYRTGEYKKRNDEAVALAERYNIDGDTYARILSNPNSSVRQRELREEVKKTYGGFKTAMNFVLLGSLSRSSTKKLERQRVPLQDSLHQLDAHIASVGSVLGLMVDENKEVRSALLREVLGEKEVQETNMSFEDMRGALKNLLSDEDESLLPTPDKRTSENSKIMREWGEFKKNLTRRWLPGTGKRGGRWEEIQGAKKYEDRNDIEKNQAQTEFWTNYENHYGGKDFEKKDGFWAGVLRGFLQLFRKDITLS